MRIARLLAPFGLAVLLAGCLQSATVINVKPDGSGTIEETLTMNAQAAAQLQEMLAGFGQMAGEKGDAKRAGKKPGIFSEEDMRSAAAKMGEGVTFVSSQPVKTADTEGVRALYAFTDVTKVRIDQKPATPGGADKLGGAPGGSAPEMIAFRFARTPAGSSQVTVVFPDAKLEPGQKPTAPAAGAKSNDPAQAAALAMAKQMFAGMKISIVLQPVGRLIRTNSAFVEGQRVTLLELDLGQLMADEALLTKLQGLGSIEQAKAALKGVKGVKVNLDKEVVVEFAGR